MRRSRKLPTVNVVSHLETHHAYISPPIPEKGGLPTIIVTPAEASAISEFEIHFYSPHSSQASLANSESKGFFPRMRHFFRRPAPMPSTQAMLEKAEYFDDDEEADVTEGRQVPRITVTGSTRQGDYVALSQSDTTEDDVVIPGVPTISEEQWVTIRSASSTGPIALPMSPTFEDTHRHNHRLLTRRVRTLLFLSVPVALVAFHLITHQMGLLPGFGGSSDTANGIWSDDMAGATPLSGPSL